MKLRQGAKRSFKKARYVKRFIALINHPLFWFLTIVGNAMIVLGAFLLYKLEADSAVPAIQMIDCLLWSTSIVTTVGYFNLVPQSFYGKVTVICLMLFGTFFVWSYMALLVSALISPALSSLEKEVQEVEKELSELKPDDQKVATQKKSSS